MDLSSFVTLYIFVMNMLVSQGWYYDMYENKLVPPANQVVVSAPANARPALARGVSRGN